MPFLPITTDEMRARGWDCADVVLVTGDAYVDHPSFGAAIVSRVLEACGWRVCILSQPRAADFTRFGRPTLGFFITGGNIDSMVAHYTAAKKKRSDDAYTAGGRAGARPDRAAIVYSRRPRPPIPTAPSFSAGWRRRCAALPITTIGTMPCAPPSWWTAGRICWCSAWGSSRTWKLPAA